MNYFGRFLSNFKDFYKEINAATLTGAIDVIVVQQQDGTFLCSPFHVRFGKMGVLRSREKVVDIEINGEPVDLHMKLGESGEAFFVEETDGEVPEYLATSPIPSYAQMMEDGLKQLHDETLEQLTIEEISNDISGANNDDKTVIDIDEVAHAMKEPTESVKINIEDVSKPVEITIETGDGQMKTSQLDFVKNSSVASLSDADSTCDRKSVSDPSKRKVKVRRKRRKSGKGNNVKTSSFERQDSHVSMTDDVMPRDESDEDIFEMEITTDDEVEEEIASINAADKNRHSKFIQFDEEAQLKGLATGHPYIPDFHPFSDGDVTPLISPLTSPRPGTPKSDTEVELQRNDSEILSQEVKWNWGELPEIPESDKKPKPQPEVTHASASEIEVGPMHAMEAGADVTSSEEAKQKQSMLGSMFRFMRRTKKIRHSQSIEGGIYLDDLPSNLDDLDPEVAALYFPKQSIGSNQIQPIRDDDKEDKEEGADEEQQVAAQSPTSIADEERQLAVQSPNSIEGGGEGSIDSGLETQHPFEDSSEQLGDLALSLCGGLKESEGEIPLEKFLQSLVTYDDFCKNPALLADPNLILRFGGKYYNWQTASPLIMSLVVFQRPLPEDTVERLTKDASKKEGGRLTSWFSWRRSNKPTDSGKALDKGLSDSSQPNSPPSSPKKEPSSPRNKSDSSSSEDDQPESLRIKPKPKSKDSSLQVMTLHREKYKKAVRLSSEQISKLNLQEGANEIVYSVTTQYQGTSRCKCNIYLWRHDDRVIVSDIDGTITKSDVMGQILPVFGKDWTQSGVASLYTSARKNGYQFLYLSARAIGQASLTKGYLKSVKQEQNALPDGPLLLSPTSLITAFHKEVIERKPEEFKIGCLRDIQALFPSSRNPFYAGFGNKINDVWAYRALAIPISRIFTINPRGEIKHELTQTFQTSYSKLSDLVDHLFPPLHGRTSYEFLAADEYSSFTYWRTPLPDVEISESLTEEVLKGKSGKK
ncbi:phosphatidate phosphatase LPIN2-like [Glandiceps talaboti]